MNILLDTSTFLWVLWNPGKLSVNAAALIKDTQNRCYLSHVSAWEMTIKYQIGKLPLPASPEQWLATTCAAHGIEFFPIGLPDIYKLCTLPHIHRDPFDRFLVAQAIANDMTLLTNDVMIGQYAAKTLW